MHMIKSYFARVIPFFMVLLLVSSVSSTSVFETKIITDIVIHGNSLVQNDAIEQRFLYKRGDVFDPSLSSAAISKLNSMGYFSQIKIEKEEDDNDGVVLYLSLSEKKPFVSFEIVGNEKISTKKIGEKLKLKKRVAIDDDDVKFFCSQIQKLYREENYHNTSVKGELKKSEDSDGLDLLITIEEGKPSQIREICFVGVTKIPEWRLRSTLLTKELWLLGFADGSGKYNPDMVEYDRQLIEFAYQDLGFANAQVKDVVVEYPEGPTGCLRLTFHIDEGDQYSIRYVTLPYDSEVLKSDFLDAIMVKEGGIYCRADATATIQRLQDVYGKYGYANAEIFPQLKFNEETKTIDFTFDVEKGQKVYVRAIDITGNKVTHDSVIRRELSLEEGALLTSRDKRISQRRIEGLGFFERNGVKFITHKLNDNLVDLEIEVTEAKTGNASMTAGYGAKEGRQSSNMNIGLNVTKRNLLGRGWGIGADLRGEGSDLWQLNFNFSNPYMFESNIESSFDFGYRRDEHSQWYQTVTRPVEQVAALTSVFAFRLPDIDRDLRCGLSMGIEGNKFVNYNDVKKEMVEKLSSHGLFLLDRVLASGSFFAIGSIITKDTRNHPIYPSQGYKFQLTNKVAAPLLSGTAGFMKSEILLTWYTQIIEGERLILAIRARAGTAHAFSGYSVPYRELYHMGGQDTVRGFVSGGAGPVFVEPGEKREKNNTPLGGTRSVLFNAELQFPMVESYGMRGRLFYDAGCGWGSPVTDVPEGSLQYVKRNDFNVRHAVGFGFSMTRPQNIKIDWGYKLDRDKKFKESEWEVSMSMNAPW
ncbi:outer membrane protein assembly factor BamA [Candidatus Dependentiae bacterium]|nr:outer membrane protein assembly factor BamA [Candidatus Dependentiae bacterium]